jgi:Uncharacterized protein conserved in bacteria (DUF2199)
MNLEDQWAQVGEPNFVRTNRMWRVEGREAKLPYRGWLNTHIPIYPNTLRNPKIWSPFRMRGKGHSTRWRGRLQTVLSKVHFFQLA